MIEAFVSVLITTHYFPADFLLLDNPSMVNSAPHLNNQKTAPLFQPSIFMTPRTSSVQGKP